MGLRVCVECDVCVCYWGKGETGWKERTQASITNSTETSTMIHSTDTVVTQLNDSAVTG